MGISVDMAKLCFLKFGPIYSLTYPFVGVSVHCAMLHLEQVKNYLLKST